MTASLMALLLLFLVTTEILPKKGREAMRMVVSKRIFFSCGWKKEKASIRTVFANARRPGSFHRDDAILTRSHCTFRYYSSVQLVRASLWIVMCICMIHTHDISNYLHTYYFICIMFDANDGRQPTRSMILLAEILLSFSQSLSIIILLTIRELQICHNLPSKKNYKTMCP